MILADTSIWIDYLTGVTNGLRSRLERGEVLMHPFVIGEISLGNLPSYDRTMQSLWDFPQAMRAADNDVLRMIRDHRLYGRGIGYVDAHLLASTRLMKGAQLWTRDRRLAVLAEGFGVGYVP
ncbi:type II toxin-antitoxin system VapC family toxin [Rhizobium sp. YIM 134829]|uniref:type II toxin-antitoxin system VapC family toxin n=1 Tax=Rhizobium sp. YIM 134829 TaxID=3390453 RepID=UPI00397E4D3B